MSSKVAPPVVQVVLLGLTAHDGSLAEVGKLALASALSFGCASLGELGFSTSFSAPVRYFGTAAPPLRPTRPLRVGAALTSSLLYTLLWAAGVGGHDWRLLLVAPLPLALSLGYGYSGVMNAHGQLSREGRVTLDESLAVLAIALALVFGLDVAPLTASLAALTMGRFGGSWARARMLRAMATSDAPLPRAALVQQMWFAASTAAFTVQNQADVVVVGALGRFVQLGVYGPLLRTAYSTVLIAEGLSWALFGRAGDQPEALHQSPRRLSLALLTRRWRAVGLALGVASAVGFALAAEPALHLILGRPVPGITVPILILAGDIVLRYVSFVHTVEIVRAGRQVDRIPVALVAAAVLVAIVLLTHSLVGLAMARICSEAVLVVGYYRIVRQLRSAGAEWRAAAAAPVAAAADPLEREA